VGECVNRPKRNDALFFVTSMLSLANYMDKKRYIGERTNGEAIVVVSDPANFGDLPRLLDPHYEIKRFTDHGFDWGPGSTGKGTAPARARQLALAILVDALEGQWLATDFIAAVALEHCEAFKRVGIDGLLAEGFELRAWAVRRWLAERKERRAASRERGAGIEQPA
jgi:hypothetical protein